TGHRRGTARCGQRAQPAEHRRIGRRRPVPVEHAEGLDRAPRPALSAGLGAVEWPVRPVKIMEAQVPADDVQPELITGPVPRAFRLARIGAGTELADPQWTAPLADQPAPARLDGALPVVVVAIVV